MQKPARADSVLNSQATQQEDFRPGHAPRWNHTHFPTPSRRPAQVPWVPREGVGQAQAQRARARLPWQRLPEGGLRRWARTPAGRGGDAATRECAAGQLSGRGPALLAGGDAGPAARPHGGEQKAA